MKNVKVGGQEQDINLPNTLKVNVEEIIYVEDNTLNNIVETTTEQSIEVQSNLVEQTIVKEELLTDIKWQINKEKSSNETFSSESAGTVYYYEPILPTGYSLKDQVTLPQIEVYIVNTDKWQFNKNQVIDNIKITVKAEKDVFPIDAQVQINKIETQQDKEKIENAVKKEAEELNKKIEKLISFDITITDNAGKEIQPDTSKGEVKVLFENIEIAEEISEKSQELKVYHINEALNEAHELSTVVDKEQEIIEVSAHEFSPYTVALFGSQKSNITYDISTGKIEINTTNMTTYNNNTITGNVTNEQEQLVIDGVTVNLTINDLNIVIDGYHGNQSGIALKNGATLNLTITGDNVLTADYGGAGISVPAGCTLNITKESTGTLKATGGNSYGGGAGIGAVGNEWTIGATANNTKTVGTININGGTIIAKGGSTMAYGAYHMGASGIGGSTDGTTGTINISGGTVTATGGFASAAIGGGYCGSVEHISITGGTINAYGDNGGAAIGSGRNGLTNEKLSFGIIELTGGSITANGNIGFGTALDPANNQGGTLSIEDTASVVINDGIISTEQTNFHTYTVSITIYDGRIKNNIENATLTIGGTKTYSGIIKYDSSKPYEGKFDCTIVTEDEITWSQAVTLSGGGYSWDNIVLTDNAGNYSGTIGEELYPVDLYFYDDAITSDISGAVVTMSMGEYALNSNPQSGILHLVYDDTIVKQRDGMGILSLWAISGSDMNISVSVNSLNSGNAMIKNNQTIKTSTDGTIIIMHDIGSQIQIEDAIDLSYGNIIFDEKGGKLNITYTPSQGGSSVTAYGQNYQNEYEIIQSDNTNPTTNQIVFKNTAELVKVKLHGVNILSQGKAIDVDKSKVQLTLVEENKIDCGGVQDYKLDAGYHMGIRAPFGSELTIEGDGKLLIFNPSRYGTGIGGYSYAKYNNTTFISSTSEGAGIIKINSGNLDISSVDGACIGSSESNKSNNYGDVYINGGTLKCTSTGYGVPLGGGSSSLAASVHINGGNVDATGKYVAIGHCGSSDSGGNIEITGGTVTANSTIGNAAIGAGTYAICPIIRITGGIINSNAIGTSGGGSGGGIIIDGGYVTANTISGGFITITGGTIRKSDGNKPKINVQPTNGSQNVYYTKADLKKVYGIDKEITNASISGYRFNDVKTDSDGLLHMFLPENPLSESTSANFNSIIYSGIITSSEPNILSKEIPLSATIDEVKSKTATINLKSDMGNDIYCVASDTPFSNAHEIEVSDGVITVGATGNDYKITLTNLLPNKTYTYYFVAKEGDSYSEIKKLEFTTLKGSIENAVISIANADDFIYDGTQKIPTIKVMLDNVEIDKNEYIVKYTNTNGGENNHTNAGTVSVEIEAVVNGNYSGKVIQTSGMSFEIAKKKLGVSNITVGDRSYDGTDKVKITDVQLSGVLPTDVVKVKVDTNNLTSKINGVDAGNYSEVEISNINLVGDSSLNYSIDSNLSFDTTVTITKAPAFSLYKSAVMIKNQANYTVDIDLLDDDYFTKCEGNPVFIVESSKYDGLTNVNINSNRILTLLSDNTNNGLTDIIIIRVANMKNYMDSHITVTVSYTDKIPVVITGASPKNEVYSKEPHKGYIGVPHSSYTGAYEISYEGRNGTIYHDTIPPVNAGSYKVIFKVPNSDNTYTGSLAINYEIEKKSITVTAVDKTVVQGSQMPKFTYKADGLANGDSFIKEPTITTQAQNTNTLGDYEIKISGGTLNNSDNYLITYKNGALKVVKKLFQVNVTSGISDKNEATEGEIVKITANEKSGYTFTNWTSQDEVDFLDSKAKTTNFTMLGKDVTINANYVQNSGGSSGGGGGGSSASTNDKDDIQLQDNKNNANVNENSNNQLNPQNQKISFNDIQNHWAKKFIEDAVAKGLLNGMGDGSFGPELETSRAMMVTLMYNIGGKTAKLNQENKFKDVDQNDWFYNAIVWANENNYVSGYEGDVFKPNKAITRQEAALLIYNLLKDKYIPENTSKQNLTPYKDQEKIALWAKDAIGYLQKNGVMSGRRDGSFDPDATLTRAELAVLALKLDMILNKY